MKKILIVYATAGIGHKKAAFAVKEALDEIAPKDSFEVTVIDALDYTNAFFKWSYLKFYLLMVNRLPLLWGLMYYVTDNFYVNLAVSAMRRFGNWLNARQLIDYLLETRPDVIVSTHFFASEVISDLKKGGALKSHLVTVVTDYRLHSWWVTEHIDTYVVASLDAKDDLMKKWCVDPSRINVLGMPVEPVFTKKLDRDRIFQTADLKKGLFTILVIGGGFGVGPIEDIVKTSGSVSASLQIIAICGHNEELVKRLEGLKGALQASLKVLGFSNNVYDYMEVADILISKSGGITVSEALAKELPLIVISPILGQETRNADFVIGAGAAIKIKEADELKGLIEDLLAHPEKVEKMKESIRAIRKPTACYDVARLAMEI